MTGVESVAVRREDVAAAGATLARAFHDDPRWRAVWPDPARHEEQVKAMFTALVATTRVAPAPARWLPDASGVALWAQPGTSLGIMASLRAGFALQRLVLGMRSDERDRFLPTLTMLDKRRQALVDVPHWYLQAIGVDPAHHGKGFGTALVGEGLARARRDAAPVYLETEMESNVAFYERLGFRVLEKHEVDLLDGLPVWLMRADPA